MKTNPAILVIVGLLVGSAATFALKFATMNANSVAAAVVWYCSAPAPDRAGLRSAVNALIATHSYHVQIDCND